MDENQNRKFHISMRTFIMVTVLAVAFLAIAGISIGVMIFVNKSSEETLLAQTEQQAGKLADQVALHHFRIQSSENTLDANINESAFLAGGRNSDDWALSEELFESPFSPRRSSMAERKSRP